jgi:hypothetical protein
MPFCFAFGLSRLSETCNLVVLDCWCYNLVEETNQGRRAVAGKEGRRWAGRGGGRESMEEEIHQRPLRLSMRAWKGAVRERDGIIEESKWR